MSHATRIEPTLATEAILYGYGTEEEIVRKLDSRADMLAALRKAQEKLASLGAPWGCEARTEIRAAILKAEGRS